MIEVRETKVGERLLIDPSTDVDCIAIPQNDVGELIEKLERFQ